MKFGRKKAESAEKSPTDTSDRHEGATSTHNDRIYALLRRLGLRVSQIELQVTALKRDVNRIERASNRAKETAPTNQEEEALLLPDPYGGR